MQVPWPRMIALVDMNAFFASVEQRDNPYWRGRPIAITNGDKGSCIITCSYEARAHGIKTGKGTFPFPVGRRQKDNDTAP